MVYPEFAYKLHNIWHRSRVRVQSGNRITFNRTKLFRSRITVEGTGNHISFDPKSNIADTRIEIRGNGHRIKFGPLTRLNTSHIVVEDENCFFEMGETSLLIGARVIIAGKGSGVRMGTGCMVAAQACIRNTDSHSILSSETKNRINYEQDVQIGNHVWIGEDVHVLKGSVIGDNTIVGAKSLVSSSLDPNSIYAGNPIQKIKSDTTWDRRRLPKPL